ncbi:MAG: CRISPR-associated protein Csx19, partial [Candidatus Eremiobacterota bacterium]
MNNLIALKSETEPLDIPSGNLEQIISNKIKANSLAVAYMDYTVLIGKYENSKFLFYDSQKLEEKYLQKLRVFNDKEELFIWRSSDGFKGRFRKDGSGKDIEAVEAFQVLFGTDVTPLGTFSKLFEERGTEVILPFTGLSVNDKKNRIFIKTRNYIGNNRVHQATYIDARFVSFS